MRGTGLLVGTFAALARCMPTIHTIIDTSQLEAVSGGFPGTQAPRPRQTPTDRDDLDRYLDRYLKPRADENLPVIKPPATDNGFERQIDEFAPPPFRQDS
jgi:hypothetical protein